MCLSCLPSVIVCLPCCWSLCPPCLPSVSFCLRSSPPSCWSLCPSCLLSSPFLFPFLLVIVSALSSFLSSFLLVVSVLSPFCVLFSPFLSSFLLVIVSALSPFCLPLSLPFVSLLVSLVVPLLVGHCVRLVFLLVSLCLRSCLPSSVSFCFPSCPPSCWSLCPFCLFISGLVSLLLGHCVRLGSRLVFPLSPVLSPFLLVIVSIFSPFCFLLSPFLSSLLVIVSVLSPFCFLLSPFLSLLVDVLKSGLGNASLLSHLFGVYGCVICIISMRLSPRSVTGCVSAGHAAFLFICLPGLSLPVRPSWCVRPFPLAMEHFYSFATFLFICLPALSLLVSALFRWPWRNPMHLQLQHFDSIRPFPLVMQHVYSSVSQVCHWWCSPWPSSMSIHLSPRSVTAGVRPFHLVMHPRSW